MELQIGRVQIPYAVKKSKRSKKPRIEVGAESFTVVAPEGMVENEIAALLERRKRWIFDSWNDAKQQVKIHPFPEKFATGSKLMVRGRWLPIECKEESITGNPEISVTDRVLIQRPKEWSDRSIRESVSERLVDMLRDQIQGEIAVFSKKVGVPAPRFSISTQMKDKWGECKKDGTLRFSWMLIFAPGFATQYAVLHELAHLKIRNHSPGFWTLVRVHMPDYELKSHWLEADGKRLLV